MVLRKRTCWGSYRADKIGGRRGKNTRAMGGMAGGAGGGALGGAAGASGGRSGEGSSGSERGGDQGDRGGSDRSSGDKRGGDESSGDERGGDKRGGRDGGSGGSGRRRNPVVVPAGLTAWVAVPPRARVCLPSSADWPVPQGH